MKESRVGKKTPQDSKKLKDICQLAATCDGGLDKQPEGTFLGKLNID